MRADMKIEMPKSLTEMVMARLEQAILDGEFGLGDAISEETLAKTFGVSRTPVRDALTALQRSGLVVVLPKRGSFVFRPTAADTAALCDYRFLLECEGLRLSRAAAPQEALIAMQAAVVAMEASLAADAVAYGRADTQFHQAFLDYCGNAYLAEAYRLASGKVAALRTHLTAQVEARRAHSLTEHRRMAALFEVGDIDALTELLAEHINRTRQVYEAALAAPEPGPRRMALI
ncbi:GntR Transcriptional regulators [Rhabdaerophilaceae bacterium]